MVELSPCCSRALLLEKRRKKAIPRLLTDTLLEHIDFDEVGSLLLRCSGDRLRRRRCQEKKPDFATPTIKRIPDHLSRLDRQKNAWVTLSPLFVTKKIHKLQFTDKKSFKYENFNIHYLNKQETPPVMEAYFSMLIFSLNCI